MKMNTMNSLTSTSLLQINADSVFCGISNFFNNNCSSYIFSVTSSNSLTFDDCIFKNNKIKNIKNNEGKGVFINCVFDTSVTLYKSFISSNCRVENNPISHILAHFITENACIGVPNDNAFGCNDGNCPDSNGCSLNDFSFGSLDIAFTEKIYLLF